MTGATLTEGSVRLGLTGHIAVWDVLVQAPDVHGPGGEILRVDRIDAAVSWPRLLGLVKDGKPAVAEVMLHQPRLRLSRNPDDGSLNFRALSLPTSGGGTAAIPSIRIDHGSIELGEHTGSDADDLFTLLKHIELHGRIVPSSPRSDGSVEIVVTPEAAGEPPSRAVAATPAPKPVTVTGTVKGSDIELSISGLSLHDWNVASAPGRARSFFQSMDLEGEIGPATIVYSRGAAPGEPALKASLELIDVAMNLPVTENAESATSGGAAPADGPLLRMSHVNGTVDVTNLGTSARLVGSIEEVPYEVELDYRGSAANSPFVCKARTVDFRMEKGLRILRFVPENVRERLADFSWPTGLVTTNVTISRGEPAGDAPAPLSVVGEMQLRDAVSAFKRFPYEFRGLSGRVNFTDTRIDILDISGRSTSGATIQASGFIEPLTPDAHCIIDVRVDNLVIDDDVIRALAVRRKGIPPTVFNQEHYNRMVAAGLIARPGDAEAGPDVPRFGLGGLATVRIRVTRPAGPDTEWLEETQIDFTELTLLPEWFPLPMIATGVEVRIGDDLMTVRGGEYRPITGGRAVAEASVDYELVMNPELKGVPEITVTAEEVATGRLLNYAVGTTIDRANRSSPTGSPGPRIRGILDDLRATGRVGGVISIFNDDEGEGRVKARISVGPTMLTPRPETPEGASIDRQLEVMGSGLVQVTDRAVEFEFEGAPRSRAAGSIGGVEQPLPTAGAIRVLGSSRPGPTGEAELRAEVAVDSLELGLPIEQLVGVFSPASAQRWVDFSSAYSPGGPVDAVVVIEPTEHESTATVRLDGFEGVSAMIEGAATTLANTAGSVTILPGGAIRFDGFAADARGDDGDLGHVEAQGEILLGNDERGPVPGRDFGMVLKNARAESPLLRTLVSRRLSAENAGRLKEFNPRGRFDAEFTVTPGAAAAGEPGLVTTFMPRSMTITVGGQDVPFESMTGTVTIRDGAGRFEAVEAVSPLYEIRADGTWSRTAEMDTDIDLTVTASSKGFPDPLRALLPGAVRGVLDSVEFAVDGEVEVPVMTLQITESDAPERQRLIAGGTVIVTGGKMTLGVPITECDGAVNVRVFNTDFQTPAGFQLDARMDRFRLAGLGMTHGMVEVTGTPETGEVVIPRITADCYGGRFYGDALVGPQSEAPRDYKAQFSLSGVRFAPTLRDITAAAGKPIDAEPVSDDDPTRGLIDAEISLAGRIDEPASRRGRGEATIAGPSVLRMPLVMPLIRFSNLQLPTDEPLDFARASFYVQGPVMAFEDLSVFSENVQIRGFGTMTWPEMALDLRFNSRAVKRIPVINWLIEGLRDEFVSTQVTGTPANPDVRSVPFDSTRRFFLEVFGSGMSEQERRMLELGKESENQPAR